MRNMSAKRMAGYSIMYGPVITLICYFAQQLVILAGVDWSDHSTDRASKHHVTTTCAYQTTN